MSIVEQDPDVPVDASGQGVETSRMNYFEVWPYRYETTGFGQVEEIKEKVVLTYTWAESAR